MNCYRAPTAAEVDEMAAYYAEDPEDARYMSMAGATGNPDDRPEATRRQNDGAETVR